MDAVYESCPVNCIAPEADRENGCPECSVTKLRVALRENYYKSLKRELKELKTEYDEETEPYSFEDIAEDYRNLSDMEAYAGAETEDKLGGYSEDWTVRTSNFIQIIREERYTVRRAVKKEQEEKDKLEKDQERLSRLRRGKNAE